MKADLGYAVWEDNTVTVRGKNIPGISLRQREKDVVNTLKVEIVPRGLKFTIYDNYCCCTVASMLVDVRKIPYLVLWLYKWWRANK